MNRPESFGALVIGAGVNGLAAAWHLVRLGVERVALVERHRIGHAYGSSHGHTRITRSSYGDETYVRLMQIAHGEEWPRLEAAAGRPLVRRCDGAFFGPADGAFERYAAAVAAVGVDVERIEPSEARRRFPLFRFPDAAGVLHDRTGGVIEAAAAIESLARRCWIDGVHVLEDTRVLRIDPSRDPLAIETDRGTLRAERLVVAAGAWAAQLVPALAPRLTVKRQTVAFFRIGAPAADVAPGRFPVWAYVGAGENGLRYGLPEHGRPGIKAALHVIHGAPDDPDGPIVPDESLADGIRRFLDEQLAVPVLERLHAETCLFTSTASEDFVIDTWPGESRIVIGSACSGHGFKFGPLTGRLLAELALHGRTSVPEFERRRAQFALARA